MGIVRSALGANIGFVLCGITYEIDTLSTVLIQLNAPLSSFYRVMVLRANCGHGGSKESVFCGIESRAMNYGVKLVKRVPITRDAAI